MHNFCIFAPVMDGTFAQIIEKWYLANRRELPWRETRDPYRIWVSEVILQQTRVAQGLDYYNRFLQRFPTVQSLAQAPLDEVLRLWQGLGYYSRARNMHLAARQVCQAGPSFPDTYQGIRSLSGIGDYTASAIMSLAYDQPYAVVDGNVYRVLSRTQGIDTPIDSTQGRKLFATLAQELLDKEHPALYNQAIMDFGAMQCTPRGCDCQACPLLHHCVAFREKRADELPVKSHRTHVRQRHLIYIMVCDADHLLLRRRGKGDIWEGLYDMPLIESPGPRDAGSIMEEPWVRTLLASGARLTLRASGLRHQLTHQTLLTDFYELLLPGRLDTWMTHHAAEAGLTDYQCIPRSRLDHYGMSRLMLQLLSH